MAGQGHVGGERIVELPVGIRRKTDGRQKIFQFLHFIGRQPACRRLQVGESRVELFQPIPVAPPVKRLVADDVLQRLRHHRPFHRMKMVGHRRWKASEIVVGWSQQFHIAGGIAQVPGQAVQARIHMTRGAGGLTEARGFVRVVKMFAARLHNGWGRIK